VVTDFGISIPYPISPKNRAVYLLDLFSAFSIQKRMIQLTGQQFDASMAHLEEIRFLNVSVDSETAHLPTLVHCAVSNPFLFPRSAPFDLCESVHFIKGSSASLFRSVVMRLMRRKVLFQREIRGD
jgi:hypothetical protein